MTKTITYFSLLLWGLFLLPSSLSAQQPEGETTPRRFHQFLDLSFNQSINTGEVTEYLKDFQVITDAIPAPEAEYRRLPGFGFRLGYRAEYAPCSKFRIGLSLGVKKIAPRERILLDQYSGVDEGELVSTGQNTVTDNIFFVSPQALLGYTGKRFSLFAGIEANRFFYGRSRVSIKSVRADGANSEDLTYRTRSYDSPLTVVEDPNSIFSPYISHADGNNYGFVSWQFNLTFEARIRLFAKSWAPLVSIGYDLPLNNFKDQQHYAWSLAVQGISANYPAVNAGSRLQMARLGLLFPLGN